jgi:predicted HAD superfamily Cof-like phosphohydrolase
MIDRIVKWQKERLLDKQPFNPEVEITNIVEEIYEMFDVKDKRFNERAIASYNTKNLIEHMRMWGGSFDNEEAVVDAFADIIVFSVGAIMKLGYDPEKVMDEVLKEIESRKGKIVDGKFVKDTSEKAKKQWYKANLANCRVR